MPNTNYKIILLLIIPAILFVMHSALASEDYLSTKYVNDLPPLAQEMLKGSDNASTTEQENITVLTSSDAFVSEVSVPKKETEIDTPPDPRNPLEQGEKNKMGVRTEFDNIDDQVRQTISLKSGMDVTSFNMNLINSSGYDQEIYQNENGDTKVYTGENEIITYTQSIDNNINDPSINLKESIYAIKPNQDSGSKYVWAITSNDPSSNLKLEIQPDGSVNIYREMLVSGIDPTNTNEQQRIMDVVSQALDNASLDNKRLIAVIEPLTYITKDNIKKTVPYQIEGNNLVISIEEKDSAYPLTIDPSLIWRQWLVGGVLGADDYVKALAINGDEIYVGGYTAGDNGINSSVINGSAAGATEGFVMELQDNAGSAPTVNWLQWLGGSGTDYVYGLAVSGEEIYAGGSTDNSSGWETPVYSGGSCGGTEGFVAEIYDDPSGTPTLNWLQWLGSDSTDEVFSVAVTGDEVYAGGYTYSYSGWESTTYTGGSFTDTYIMEGFVVELADNASAAPTLNWKQWLGRNGGNGEKIYSVAVVDNEVYAGGLAQDMNSGWESFSYTIGDGNDYFNAFVAEMIDNASAAPTLNWIAWVGEEYTYFGAMAVNNDEIYVAGYINTCSLDPSTTYFGGSCSGSSYQGWVMEIADNAGAPSGTWLQYLGTNTTNAVTVIYALAVNSDEVYAAGYSTSAGSWEAATYTGGTLSGTEAFVLEMTDNASAAPTINWRQWVGGSGTDYIYAVAYDGDEVYIGGTSDSDSTWESASSTGDSYKGNIEGFVIELQDNATAAPGFNWMEWVGAYKGIDENVKAIAITGDEIYAGGYTGSSSSFSTASYSGGTLSGGDEGFVVEINNSERAAPTLNWRQFLGGAGNDYVASLAVTGDEIYAGGYTGNATNWESAVYNGGTLSGVEGFVVELDDNASAAPTLSWRQWLGGTGSDYVYALTLNGDEIYAGGSSDNTTSWESASSTYGILSSTEGFVIELDDNIDTGPTLSWLQWLGGTGSDYVYALAVDGDEIYAGGNASNNTSWESASSTYGTLSGLEGFVVELDDNIDTGPTLSWLQWLGGTGSDYVYALAVNGDEIYAGGYTTSGTSWESASSTSGTASGNEGFVVELDDNIDTGPTLSWIQWLGGSGSDYVYALAVNGDEVYAGGSSNSSSAWESAIYTGGTFNGSTESFVAEILDNGSPALNWLYWLGGGSEDYINGLAVYKNKVYAVGYSSMGTGWETFSYTNGSYLNLKDGIVLRIKDDISISYSKFPTAVKEASLVGYWSFNGPDMDWGSTTAEALDMSNHGNRGDVIGASRTTGYNGQGLNFDGTDDYIDVPVNSSLKITSAVTLAGWVKFDSLAQSSSLFGRGNHIGADADRGPYKIGFLSPNALYWSVGDGVTSSSLSPAFVPIIGTWYYIVGTWDGATNANGQKLYINGVLYGEQNSTVSSLKDALTFRIGLNDFSSATQYHDGAIDEVRVYNRALSADEVAEIYRQSTAGIKSNSPAGNIISNGLIGSWSFNGPDMGTTSAIDRSGYNNTAWLINNVRPKQGIVGQALDLDGANNYIEIPDNNSLDFGTGGFTVSFWIKTPFKNTPGAGVWPGILTKGVNATAPAHGWGFLQATQTNNKLNFCQSSDAGGTWVASLTSPALSAGWHHILARRTGNATTELYIDGVYNTVDETAGSDLTNSSNLRIGRDASSDYSGFVIDEIRIYNRAVSTTEISELYRQSSKKIYYKE